MTIFYPDISGYDQGISLSGMVAVVVKATEGTTYTNPDYARVARDAAARGIPWAAYHFLRHTSDPAAQARHYFDAAGRIPCMLDVETATDGSRATVGDALAFASALKRLGGVVRLVYLPHWYWQALGSPDLRPLTAAGMALVSSNYPSAGYTDSGPGWAAYGGVTPTIWQYTDAHPLNGCTVDMNAYRGTVDQFRALLNGGTPGMDETQRLAHNADAYTWHLSQMDATIPNVLGGDGTPMELPNKLAATLLDIQGNARMAAQSAGAVSVNVTQEQLNAAIAAAIPALAAAIGADLAARLQS